MLINNHKCEFIQDLNGPFIVTYKCRICNKMIVDIINRGPNRIEINKDGMIVCYGKVEK